MQQKNQAQNNQDLLRKIQSPHLDVHHHPGATLVNQVQLPVSPHNPAMVVEAIARFVPAVNQDSPVYEFSVYQGDGNVGNGIVLLLVPANDIVQLGLGEVVKFIQADAAVEGGKAGGPALAQNGLQDGGGQEVGIAAVVRIGDVVEVNEIGMLGRSLV